MAKSKVSNITLAAPEMSKYMNVDLEADELEALKESKVGEQVVLVIKGKLSSISQSKRMRESGKAVHTGSINLEDFEVEVGTNEIWNSMTDD